MRQISAVQFVDLLAVVLKAQPPEPWSGAADWTFYITSRLRDLAARADAHLCASTLGVLVGKERQEHQRREYVFDFTIFTEWNDYSLPAVVIEHENQWTEAAFMFDMWKLMIGHAPLRVMFGYANTPAAADHLIARLREHAHQSSWTAPSGVEDLVLVGHGGMDPIKDWRVVRRHGVEWRLVSVGPAGSGETLRGSSS